MSLNLNSGTLTTLIGATNSMSITNSGAVSIASTLGVTGLGTFSGGLTSTAGTTTLGATTIGAITGTSATFSSTLGVSGISTLGATNSMTVSASGLVAIQNNTSVANLNAMSSTSGSLNINGDLTLYNATKNTIVFSTGGIAPPSSTTARSVGTKLVLYPSFVDTQFSDFALGIESNTLWYSVPTNTTHNHRWYGGTTQLMNLSGTGILTLPGTTTSISTTTGALVVSGGVGISNTTDAVSSTNGGTITTAGGAAIAKKLFVGTDLSVSGISTLGATNSMTISAAGAVNIASTLGVTGLGTFSGGLTSTAGTTTLGATTIGAITGTSATFSSTLRVTGATAIGAITDPNNISELFIRGNDQNISSGPHIAINTAADNFPVFHQLNWKHDNICLGFDTYWDGSTFRTSHTTNGFGIYKIGNELKFQYSNSTGAGTATTMIDALKISSTGVVTLNNLTASQAVFTNASKNLISVATTGTGNVVLATSPTLVTPNIGVATATSINTGAITGTSATFSSTLGVSGALSLNDNSLKLRSNADSNHQLFWLLAIDGPVLHGLSAGRLAIGASGVTSILDWNSSGINIPRTTASTSNSIGAILTAGGIGISNTTDASSSTNGGTFTTAGGAAIAKKLFVGTDLSVSGISTLGSTNSMTVSAAGLVVVNNTTNATSSTSAALRSVGGISSNLDIWAGGKIITDSYVSLTNVATFGPPLLDSISTGTRLLIYPDTGASTTDYAIGIESATMWYSIPTNTTHNHRWYGGTDQIMNLRGDGILTLPGTTQSLSTTTGTLVVSGGVGISNTTDASSSTNGGTITTAGGAAIAKKLFVGTDLSVSGISTLGATNSMTVSATGLVAIQNSTIVANSNTMSSTSGSLNINGDLTLYNATKNTIVFTPSGSAAPSFNTRSVGTKIILYPNVSASSVDDAIGIETNVLWYSIDQAISTKQHRWYGGTTQLMNLRGDGILSLPGTTVSTSTTTGTLVVSGGVGIAGAVNIGSTLGVSGAINGTTATFSGVIHASASGGGQCILVNTNSQIFSDTPAGSSNLKLTSYGGNGITIAATTGRATFAGGITSLGTLDVYDTVYFDTTMYVNGLATFAENMIIDGTGGFSNVNYAYFTYNGNVATGVSSNSSGVSLQCAGRVLATEFDAFSDIRIKKDISDLYDKDIEIMMLCKLKKYKYIDVLNNGTNYHYGLIAQDVLEYAPEMTTMNTGYIPNIFKMATYISNNKFALDYSLNIGDKLKLYCNTNISKEEKQTEILCTIIDYNNGIYTVDTDKLTKYIFVYGLLVDDMLAIDYIQFIPLLIKGYQQQHYKFEEVRNEIDELKSMIREQQQQINRLLGL